MIYNSIKLSKIIVNSLENDKTGMKNDRLSGKNYSLEEAKNGLTSIGTKSQNRIIIGLNDDKKLILIDGRHLLEAYRILNKEISSQIILFVNLKTKGILIKKLGE